MSINPRRVAGGKVVYDVRLRTPDGRQYKRTFRTKREAELFEASDRTERNRGGWVDPSAGWSWTLAQSDPSALAVTMTNGTRTFEFTAATTADGNVAAAVDEPIVTAASAGNGGGHHDDEDEHDEYEGGEDDD